MDIQELLKQNELHMAQVLRAELKDLGFAPDVLRILKGHGIATLNDLTSRSRAELMKFRFLGKANVDGIERVLEKYDLKLSS